MQDGFDEGTILLAIYLGFVGVFMALGALKELWDYLAAAHAAPVPVAVPPLPSAPPAKARKHKPGRNKPLPAAEPPRPATGRRMIVRTGVHSPVRGCFHADQCISGRAVQMLLGYGLDVTTTAEANLIGASDAQQLAHADQERRILLTHDRDFLALDAQGRPHAGIVHAPTGRKWRQELLRVCLRLAGRSSVS
jgi:hypothetical protein